MFLFLQIRTLQEALRQIFAAVAEVRRGPQHCLLPRGEIPRDKGRTRFFLLSLAFYQPGTHTLRTYNGARRPAGWAIHSQLLLWGFVDPRIAPSTKDDRKVIPLTCEGRIPLMLCDIRGNRGARIVLTIVYATAITSGFTGGAIRAIEPKLSRERG